MNKICVYSCITGEYDNINEIKKEDGIDYIFYTNNKNIKSKSWNVKYISDDKLSDVKLARKIKILGTDELKKYDIVIWIDGNINPIKSINKFIKEYVDLKEYDLISLKHSVRNTTFEEIEKCFELNKENPENINKLLNLYKEEKFKDVIPLIESGILIRNFNNKELNKTMKIWFDMVKKYSHRDQLSFGYSVFKNHIKVNLLNIKQYDNPYFKIYNHNNTITNIKIEYLLGNDNKFNFSTLTELSIQNNKELNIKSKKYNSIKILFKSIKQQLLLKYNKKYNYFNVATDKNGNVLINDNSYIIINDINNNSIVLNILKNGTYLYNEIIKELNYEMVIKNNTINELSSKINEQNEMIKELDAKAHYNILNKIKNSIRK